VSSRLIPFRRGPAASAPSPREQRLAAHLQGLAQAAGHRDRHQPLTSYCLGLLLPGERKGVEPTATRLDPNPRSSTNVRRAHQFLHHVVAGAPWNDQPFPQSVRHYVLPQMTARAPLSAWGVADTGFPRKGKHSFGVARQYCRQVGKHGNYPKASASSARSGRMALTSVSPPQVLSLRGLGRPLALFDPYCPIPHRPAAQSIGLHRSRSRPRVPTQYPVVCPECSIIATL
jgi:hypothetical protein